MQAMSATFALLPRSRGRPTHSCHNSRRRHKKRLMTLWENGNAICPRVTYLRFGSLRIYLIIARSYRWQFCFSTNL